jgi:LEA14-like dessication related protein
MPDCTSDAEWFIDGGAAGYAVVLGSVEVIMHRLIRLVLAAGVAFLLSACATFSPYDEDPAVTVTSFAMAPESTSTGPVFRVGLRVINPNRVELPLVGMSYRVELQGQRVLTGAANDLPVVPAYGSADFTVDLSPDLLGGLRLIGDLMARPTETFDYRFAARLDVGGWRPNIRIEETGQLSGLSGARAD